MTLDQALDELRTNVDDFTEGVREAGDRWSRSPRAGRWSPAQVTEHVARAFEASVDGSYGKKTPLPSLPAPLAFVARKLLFAPSVRKGSIPKAKTNRGMNPGPSDAPATIEDGMGRLTTAHGHFEGCVRDLADRGATARHPVFGPVDLVDLVRFNTIHLRHHRAQLDER